MSSSISKKCMEELSKKPSLLITIFMNSACLYLDLKLVSRFLYFVCFSRFNNNNNNNNDNDNNNNYNFNGW